MAIDYRIFDRDKFTVIGDPTITDDGIANFYPNNGSITSNITLSYLKDKSWKVKNKWLNRGIADDRLNEAIIYFGTPSAYGLVENRNGDYLCFTGRFGDLDDNTGTTQIRVIQKSWQELGFESTPDELEVELSFDINTGTYTLKYKRNNEWFIAGTYIPPTTSKQLYNIYNAPDDHIGVSYYNNIVYNAIDLKYFTIEVGVVEVFSGSHLGTLTDKLVYLNDTKQKIKDAINKFDTGLVTDTTPFRQYSDILSSTEDTIKDGIDTINVSTTGASISDKIDAANNSRESIKNAINNKGGSVTDSTPLADYAQAIENIPSGGGNIKYNRGRYKIAYGGNTPSCIDVVEIDHPSGLKGLRVSKTYEQNNNQSTLVGGIQPFNYYQNLYLMSGIYRNKAQQWQYVWDEETNTMKNYQLRDFIIRHVFIPQKQATYSPSSAVSSDLAYFINGLMYNYQQLPNTSGRYAIHAYYGMNEFVDGLEKCKLWFIINNGSNGIKWYDANVSFLEGDIVDLSYEFINDGTDLQITIIINNGEPIIRIIDNATYGVSNVGSFANVYFSLSGALTSGNMYNNYSSLCNSTLLEGTSIYCKPINKYTWQLFERIDE